jgi:two-component system nitrate/nitrite response regulator NarL
MQHEREDFMPKHIRVVILDDHQSIIDGYLYRLGRVPQIEVVATLAFGEDLEPALAKHPTDVLLLDINVPTAPDNSNPYPILHTMQKLLDLYPGLYILVITMHNEPGIIRSVMETGASGYLLKEDQAMIRDLGNVVLSVASGGIFLSQLAHQVLLKHSPGVEGGQLSGRQLEALSLCAAYPDSTTVDLSRKMSVSYSTVRNLLSAAYLRLGVHSRMAAVTKARMLGILTPISPNTTPRQSA